MPKQAALSGLWILKTVKGEKGMERGGGIEGKRQHELRSNRDGEVDRGRIGGETRISGLDKHIFLHEY